MKLSKAMDKFLPTIKRICLTKGTPYQICFSQLMVESAGEGELSKFHNYFGIKYPKGRKWKAKWKVLGQPGWVVVETNERVKIKTQKEYNTYVKNGYIKIPEKNLKFPVTKKIRLPQKFCSFETMEKGIEAWCSFMNRKHYDDRGIFSDDPLHWVSYKWMRGYATANRYVEAVEKRLKSIYKRSKNEDFNFTIDRDLSKSLDEARKLFGKKRWAYAKKFLSKHEQENKVSLKFPSWLSKFFSYFKEDIK